MAYRSNIKINDHLLKDAIFSIDGDCITVEHDDIVALAFLPNAAISLEIVTLRTYQNALILAAQGDSIIVDLWAIAKNEEEARRATFKRRGPKPK